LPENELLDDFQVTWFNDPPMWTSISGACVVVGAVCAMALEEKALNFIEKLFGSNIWC